MSKPFYYDFFSLRDVDPENWSRDFFWPVPRDTTTRITTALKNRLVVLAEKQNDRFFAELLIIAHLMPDASIRSVNHLLAVNRIKDKKYDIVYNKGKLDLIPQLLENPKEIIFQHEDLWSRYKPNFFKKILKHLRYFLISCRYNFKRGRFRFWEHFKKNPKVIAFSNENVIYRPSTEAISDWIILGVAELWLDFEIPLLEKIKEQKLENLAKEYLDIVVAYAKNEYNLELPENLKRGLKKYNFEYLCYLAKLFIHLKTKVDKYCPQQLFTPTAGSSFIRALSFAAREKGCKVRGFPHGYFICHHKGSRKSLHEFATVDEFMTYTSGSVNLFEQNVKINPPPLKNNIKFLYENNSDLQKQWLCYTKKPLPEKSRKVMVLELSLIPEWAGYYAAESMVNFHFYYNICKVLTNAGYKVLFKRRPKDDSWNGINIFRNLPNIEIIYGSFEDRDIRDQADAYVIQYGMSSTLYRAMCTNKKVIYADAGWEDWFDEPYKLMSKRCSVLHCHYDKFNRACFDNQELLKILEEKPKAPNTEFMEKYLFPN